MDQDLYCTVKLGSRGISVVCPKLDTYRLSGVQEYWIIDPKQESIMIYVFAHREISLVKFFEKDAIAVSKVFSGLSANVDALFSGLLPALEL